MKNKLRMIITALKRHDWFYEFSDDASVWVRGEVGREFIFKLLDTFDEDLALRLYSKYAPDHYKDNYKVWRKHVNTKQDYR